MVIDGERVVKQLRAVRIPAGEIFALELAHPSDKLLLLTVSNASASPIGNYYAHGDIPVDSPLLPIFQPMRQYTAAAAAYTQAAAKGLIYDANKTSAASAVQLELLECIEAGRDQLSKDGAETPEIAAQLKSYLGDRMLDLCAGYQSEIAALRKRDYDQRTAKMFDPIFSRQRLSSLFRKGTQATSSAIGQAIYQKEHYIERTSFEWKSAQVIVSALANNEA